MRKTVTVVGALICSASQHKPQVAERLDQPTMRTT